MTSLNFDSFYKKLVSTSLAGALGCAFIYPLEGMKKRIQSGQLVTFSLREIYRGASSSIANMGITTMTSMSCSYRLKPLLRNDDLTPIISGLTASLVSTPMENIILTQQLHTVSPFKALHIMIKQGGLLRPYVGLRELALRESGFAYMMLRAIPATQEAVFTRTNNKNLSFIAGICTSIVGAAMTQPFDTLAVYRQKTHGTDPLANAIRTLFERKALFKGLPQRTVGFLALTMLIPRIEKVIASQL